MSSSLSPLLALTVFLESEPVALTGDVPAVVGAAPSGG